MKKLFAVILSLSFILGPMPAARAGSGGGAYAQQILGIGNGIVGATIIAQCTLASTQPSVLVYMAGSLVYIMAEITGAKGKANSIDSQSQSLDELKANMTNGGDYQKAAIQAQIDNEKSNLEFIQKRRKWFLATKAIYGVATALALMEFWLSLPTPAGINKPDTAGCSGGTTASPLVKTVAMAYSSLMSSGGNLKGMAVGMALQMAVKKLLPQIQVGASIASKGAKLLDKSLGRVAFFAAALALVQVIDSGLASEESDSKKKIADLEKVKDQFDGSDNAIAEGSVTSGSSSGGDGDSSASDAMGPNGKDTLNPGTNYAITTLPKGTVVTTKNCYSNTNGSIDYSEAGCKTPYKLAAPKYDMNMKMPTLVSAGNYATDLGNAIASGDMAKADIAAGNLNSMAANINSIKDDLMKKTNERLVANGGKAIDPNADLQGQLAAVGLGLNQLNGSSGLASSGSNNQGQNANSKFGAATTSGTNANTNGKNDSGLNIKTASSGSSVTLPGTDLSQLAGSGNGNDNLDNASGVDSKMLDALNDPNGRIATLEKNAKNYADEGEIAPDVGVSLFKQVSDRYFLNYKKIFERKKLDASSTPATPAPSHQ